MRVTFIIADTYRAEVAMIHEGQTCPYRKRSVTIDLTDEQIAAISPRRVGKRGPDEVYEEVLECFIEHDAPSSDREPGA